MKYTAECKIFHWEKNIFIKRGQTDYIEKEIKRKVLMGILHKIEEQYENIVEEKVKNNEDSTTYEISIHMYSQKELEDFVSKIKLIAVEDYKRLEELKKLMGD